MEPNGSSLCSLHLSLSHINPVHTPPHQPTPHHMSLTLTLIKCFKWKGSKEYSILHDKEPDGLDPSSTVSRLKPLMLVARRSPVGCIRTILNISHPMTLLTQNMKLNIITDLSSSPWCCWRYTSCRMWQRHCTSSSWTFRMTRSVLPLL